MFNYPLTTDVFPLVVKLKSMKPKLKETVNQHKPVELENKRNTHQTVVEN